MTDRIASNIARKLYGDEPEFPSGESYEVWEVSDDELEPRLWACGRLELKDAKKLVRLAAELPPVRGSNCRYVIVRVTETREVLE